MRRARLLPLLLLLLAAVPAWARVKPLPTDPRAPGLPADQRLTVLLQRVRIAQRGMRTLTAEFTQERQTALLVAPEEAHGTFYYEAPDRVRWAYRTPNPMQVLIDRQEMVTWYQDLGRAERVKIGHYADQVMKYLGASNSLDLLSQYFNVEVTFPKDVTRPYELALTPRFSRVAKRLKSMHVWIDPQLFVPTGLRYEEPDGDVTEYRFEKVRLNAALPADTFDLRLPPGTPVKTLALGRGR
jgi:outer membrane lipoprotein-sorting protein